VIAYTAVDVLEGRAVRLLRGLRGERTDYGDALEVILRWADAGIEDLHVVDLGAAFGEGESLTALLRGALRLRPGLRVQAAGGLRSTDAALRLAGSGAAKVVLGSLLFERPEEASRVVESLGPGRCVAALDVGPGGAVRTRGWLADTGVALDTALALAAGLGFREALVTGIGRDGTLEGPDMELYERAQAKVCCGRHPVASTGGPPAASLPRVSFEERPDRGDRVHTEQTLGHPIPVQLPFAGRSRNDRADVGLIASGGIRNAADLMALRATPRVTGAVVGKALYEGLISPEEMGEASP
jgi:phosphoribosylformimino-5-aminoimidazole carboxamide ribonucleotide (ProFAR) isomerase